MHAYISSRHFTMQVCDEKDLDLHSYKDVPLWDAVHHTCRDIGGSLHSERGIQCACYFNYIVLIGTVFDDFIPFFYRNTYNNDVL